MKVSIQYKLFAAMFLTAFSVIGLMSLVLHLSFHRGFLEYVNIEEQAEVKRLAKQLENYYAEKKSWKEVEGSPLEILKLMVAAMPPGKARHKLEDIIRRGIVPDWLEDSRGREGAHRRYPAQRILVFDEAGKLLFGRKLHVNLPPLVPIFYGEQEVGRVGMYPPQILMQANQVFFAQRQKQVLLVVCGAAMAITVIVSLVLAYHLTKPIRMLSAAVRGLAGGDYTVRVENRSKDELENLSHDVNTLAHTLEENESMRKRWASDIAHELRTPLTSLKGEIESLQDGIRKPGQQTYTNLYNGVIRLERLIMDLYDLSRSDQGLFALIPQKLNLAELIEDEIGVHMLEVEQAGLEISVSLDDELLEVEGDRQRLQQLVGNLLTNSIRYTSRGGRISVSLLSAGQYAELIVQDSAPGVSDEDLPRLFDRLYRVEQSRNRAFGGAGLGLAISERIVLAHHGTIEARHAEAGGLLVAVRIPLCHEENQ